VRYRLDDRFDVAAFDNQGTVYIKGMGLSMLEKDNWLGNFPFAESSNMVYENLFDWEGEEYWRVHYGHLLGYKRNGEMKMLGGNVLVDELSGMSVAKSGLIELLSRPQEENKAEGRILSIGDPLPGQKDLGLRAGDIVAYDKRYAQEYEIDGVTRMILRQNMLLAKKQNAK
jgi:co-chaperonin GroES (HSP10)